MGYYTVTTTYEQMKAPATRTGTCPGCGKKVRRSRTFTQTVNPFNTTPMWDGKTRPKTRMEVQQAVRKQAEAWQPDPEVFRHAACEVKS